MREVVVYELLSLDGVGEEPSDWLFDVDTALIENLRRIIGRQDTVLLGRRTYDEWADYWPASPVEPFATFINGTPKHVVTSSPPKRAWSGSTVVDAPLVEHVAALKARDDGGDIGVHGSLSVARSLLAAGLVDELRLVLAPTVAGRGRRLFEGEGELRRFELVDAERTPAGAMLLGYRAHNLAKGVSRLR